MQAKNNNLRLVTVFGATGKQGGAVARKLLESGRYRVRAVTRDPSKDEAKRLTQLGAEVVSGDMSKRECLENLMKGAHAVFSVQNTWECGPDEEIRQGKALADVAKALGTPHFIYSSVGAAERKTGLPHFESKWQIEEYIRGLGLKYTILRPDFFMENWFNLRSEIMAGTFRQALRPNKKLQVIAVDDIGMFAFMAIERPVEFMNKEIELAGSDLSGLELSELFSKELGRKVQYEELSVDKLQPKEMRDMYKWLNEYSYSANIPELRKLHPGLKTVEQWLHHTRFLEGTAQQPTTAQMPQQKNLPQQFQQQRV